MCTKKLFSNSTEQIFLEIEKHLSAKAVFGEKKVNAGMSLHSMLEVV